MAKRQAGQEQKLSSIPFPKKTSQREFAFLKGPVNQSTKSKQRCLPCCEVKLRNFSTILRRKTMNEVLNGCYISFIRKERSSHLECMMIQSLSQCSSKERHGKRCIWNLLSKAPTWLNHCD